MNAAAADVVLVFGIIQGVTACNNKREIVLRYGEIGNICTSGIFMYGEFVNMYGKLLLYIANMFG